MKHRRTCGGVLLLFSFPPFLFALCERGHREVILMKPSCSLYNNSYNKSIKEKSSKVAPIVCAFGFSRAMKLLMSVSMSDKVFCCPSCLLIF